MQYRFGTSSTRAFELLEEIGRDCVGAVQLLPPDVSSSSVKIINGEPLTDAEVAEELQITRSPHLESGISHTVRPLQAIFSNFPSGLSVEVR